MRGRIEVDPGKNAKRWVCYLDLLGFSELVRTKDWIYVFSHYAQAIDYFIKDRGFEPAIDRTWVSDTFIMYSRDNAANSFAAIEATTRWFIYFLICAGIPVRGAMSCDDFYADKENNVFFGQALIEAYQYGENQNWIGFVLCPSAVNQMATVGLPANKRLNYAYWDIPYKRLDSGTPKSLPAYIIGVSNEINGKNPCLEKLEETKEGLRNNRIKEMYANTIRFIKANKRTVVND